MSKEKSNRMTEDIEKDFSNVDLALDARPEPYSEKEQPKSNKFNDNFQEEFKAVFEGNENKNRIKVHVAKTEGLLSGIFDWVRCVVFAISVVVICLTFVFRLVEVDGSSMYNTLADKDKVIVTNLFYTPHNNDIVVIAHGAEYFKPIIKRVIAVEGQSIKLDYENDKIFVDGIELSEPYILDSTFANSKGNNQIPDVIPEGKIFVMGDNRRVSLDSRSTEIGLIDVHDVIGKAQFVAYPFDHFGYLYE